MKPTMYRKFQVATLGLLIALFAWTVTATAQTYRGGVNGTVTDNSGAVIPNATVTITNVDTGAVKTAPSTSAGEFLFQDLPLGTYSVVVSSPGFSTVKTDKVNVSAGVIFTLPVKLSISSSATTIEVEASAIALDTTSTVQNTVIDSKTVEDIPLNGRDFTQMIALTPGFGGYSGGGFGSLNGTRANQVNWQIDGVDNNDLWHNVPAVNQGGVSGIAGIILPIDAVDQFSAQTQAGPEGGRNPGGTVNLTLKSGTNSIHGTAYYFNRNELFGAKSPFSDTKQKVRNYNTGFSLGGPFLKDRLFGFVTYEQQRFVIGESGTATEPSVGWQNQAIALLNQQGRAVNPVMQNVLNDLWGTSVLAADTAGTVNNFHSTDPEFGYSYNGLGKVDYKLSDKDQLSAHWFVGQGNQVAPVGSQLLAYYEVAPIHVQNIAIVYSRQISPTISNEMLAGVNYFNQVFNDYKTNQNVQALGFVTGATFPNAPNITIKGFDPVGLTPPEGRNDITGHLTDQVSWVKGKHQFRFGGEFRQAQLDEFYHRHATGSFTFDGTQVVTGGSGRVDALADFLAGQTSAASITIGDPDRQVFVNTWFINAGDSWQVSQKLNINYGVRYDYEGPLHNQYKNLSVFRPALTATNGLAFQGSEVDSLYPKYYKNISPRVGFSYSLDENTVLRAGYGWYADTPNLNPFLDNRPGNQAPNGVEGNPGGGDPVFSVSAANGGSNTTIQQGVPIFPSSAGYPCSATSPCGVFTVAPNFRPSYNENYTFNVERTLSKNVIAELGYVGSSARHLLSLLDINQAAPGIYASDFARQQTRPYYGQYAQYGNINQISSIGTANYNSLQAQLRVSNWHHLTTQAVYTWAHNLDEVSQYRGTLPQDSTNFKGDYGNSDYDTRNNFTAFLSYEVPGSQRMKLLTQGWQVNTLMNFHGGQPFQIFAGTDNSGTNEGLDRVNQVASARTGINGQSPNATWINLSSFALPAAGTFGTLRRNQFYGPGFSDVDFSVFKNFKVYERLTVQLRAELFNTFNRINYAPPSISFAALPNGQFDPSNGSATLNDTIGDYNGAPGIGSGEPFNAQFGGKIIF
ncbi:outer membrane receptor protein involved in Fe transport [Granulicella aggregans]|uniref:Outer membrane receptor protein involved in Fe transport n=1 Tax=Granulicella aggregans TaxID=474949 RepID=A0A7W7ZF43_9BACT|nr:outer membrane receptor protein involved in Fe transport [Granulicella aggregans]